MTNTWFFLLLLVSLGMQPFSQTKAEYRPSQERHTHTMSHESHMEKAAMDHNNCKGCSTLHSCGSSSCACYQCGTCGVTLLHGIQPLNVFASLTSPLTEETGAQLPHYPFLLFRPPRA